MLLREVLLPLLLLGLPTSFAELRQVTLVIRHGERTPQSTYKDDIYKNEDFFPYGWGQLINLGKLNQYKQGKWLRKRYRNFLGEILTPSLIKAYSTTPDRAQMSMSLMLAGLMPPTGVQIWNEDLIWQPFPWTVSSPAVDKLLLSTSCPRIQEALEEVEKSNEVLEFNRQNEELYQYLSEHTGEKIESAADVFDVLGTLTSEKGYGLELPEWTRKVYPEKMEIIGARHFFIYTQTQELIRLTGGQLLKKILESFKSKITTNVDNPKVIAYAGHDSTIVNILRAFGVWEEQVPGYNIMVIIELHSPDENKEDDWYMKVMLKNSTEREPYTLKIPGCSQNCPFQQVVKLTADVIPHDLETECKPKDDNFKPFKPPSGP